jgi:hypothetical protein
VSSARLYFIEGEVWIKMKKLFTAFMMLLLLAGCGNATYDKAMEQGKLAVAKGEYDKAAGLFELALDEKPDDTEAKHFYEILIALSDVKEAVNSGKWEEALTKANKLLKEKNLPSSMKKDIQQSIQTAESAQKQFKAVTERIEKIKTLVNEKKYVEAQNLINELKQDESIKDVYPSFSGEVGTLKVAVNEELKKQKEAEEAAKEKARVEAERKKNEISWATYYNGRFGFTIQYPKDWVLGPEADNGDGLALYKENDAEVLVYASNYMEEYKPDLSNYKKITTKAGYEAYLLEQNDSFDGIIIYNGIEFHLNVTTMNQSFNQKYSVVLKQMFMNVRLD